MHRSIARRFIFGILLLSCLGGRSFGLNVEDGKEELLRTLVAKNEAARARFASFSIEQEWRLHSPYDPEAPPGAPPEDVKGLLKLKLTQHGEYFLLTRTEELRGVTGKWKEDRELQAVLGPGYYAEYMKVPLNIVHLWDRHASGELPEQPQRLESWFRKPCALDFLFGDGDGTLKRLVEKGRPDLTWRVEERQLEGEPVYVLVATFPAKDGIRKGVSEYCLDANKDFLLRSVNQYNVDGSLSLSTEVGLQFSESSRRWAPSTVHVRRYDIPALELWLEVKSLELNPTVDASFFTIESLDILPETRMTRYIKQGRVANYVFQNGIWVPK